MIQNLGSFLGLTGYFRPLIRNYSLLEKPLKDLLNMLEVLKLAGKHTYQNAARAHQLQNQWSSEHDKVFVTLKIMLTSSPVLKGPKYNGSSFTVTTDRCKDGFAGILTQRFEWVDSHGTAQMRSHPIAFASKHTSNSETRYLHIVEHAHKWKAAFDRNIAASQDGVIKFTKCDLIQIQDSKLDFTLATEAKLLPCWGAPHWITDQIRNSYQVEMIHGLPVAGRVSARQLWQFIPRPGTTLALVQLKLESERVAKPNKLMEGADFEDDAADSMKGRLRMCG